MSVDIVPHVIDCARRGDRDRLSTLKSTGDLDRRDFSDRTALMSVADTGDVEGVQALLAAGADPNLLNHTGRSALMYAAFRGHTETVRALVAGGAKPNLRDRRGRTALDYCYLNATKNAVCWSALRDLGAQVGARAPRGLRRIIRAAVDGDQFSDCQHRQEFWVGVFVGALYYSLTLAGVLLVVAMANGMNPVLSAVVLALSSVTFVLVTARLVVPLFPAVIRLGARLIRAQPVAGREPSRETENVDVRSPEFFCSILEQGERQFGKWRRRNLAGSVLADERLDWPLLVSTGILALSLIGLLALPFVVGGEGPYSAWQIVLVLVALWILETYLRGVRLRLAQRRVDGLANDVNRLLDQSSYEGTRPHGPFAVYLRPFYSTNRLHFGGSELETLLAYSFRPYMPIIGLGKPGEHVGAGRIETTDERWKGDITRLADASEMILCIPSATEGTLWELDLLAQRNWLDKTIFMMPPATGEVNYEREWERVRASRIQDVLPFPPYVADGLVFRLGHETGVEVFTPLRLQPFTLQPMHQEPGGGNTDDGGSSDASDHASENAADAPSADFEMDQAFDLSDTGADGGDGSESGHGDGSHGGDGGGHSGGDGGGDGGDGGG